MVEKDKYLVVVSIRQGRNFPKRPKQKLIVEARFEGELLSTDPVEHGETPDFSQELAWELDKKSLHQHRMQRTSVKVQVYSQDSDTSLRETIGYVILDLRSAQSHSVMKSYPLLHTKYRRHRPEVELSLYIDEGKTDAQTASERAKSVSDKGLQETNEPIDLKLLKPVLMGTDGYYQIGPADSNSKKFILSTTVAFASNLVQLVPTNIALPSSGYFFYYSLLGNDVTTEVFLDLLNPSFPAERASVRLSGNLEMIRQFFTSQPGLEMHLCCGDQSLGSCEIPLGSLLKKGSTEIYMRPVSVEGAFQLTPPKSSKLAVPRVLPEDQRAVVGVSVVLRLDGGIGSTPPAKDYPLSQPGKVVDRTRVDGVSSKVTAMPEQHTVMPLHSEHDGSYTETLESNGKSDEKSNNLREQAAHHGKGLAQSSYPETVSGGMGDAPGGIAGVIQSNDFGSPDLDSRATGDDISSDTQHHIAVPAVPHHFRVSVDLRSIASLHVSHATLVFLRYTYLFFGSSSPVLTEPPVEVRRGTEVKLPKSFCAFDFATTFQQLQDTFNRVPLVVEVWQRDHQMSQNTCLGVTQVALSKVLKSPKSKTVHSSGATGWKQACSDQFPVISTDGQQRRLGDLHVSLSLEDWGPIVPQTVVMNSQLKSDELQMAQTVPSTPPSTPSGKNVHPRETVEYQVALELERWKEQQQKIFEDELRDKERLFVEEYKRQNKEQQLLVAKLKTEYDKSTEELRKTLTDLEKREKSIAADEQKMINSKTTLEREHRRKMTELEDASRRLKEDCDHQVALERRKVTDLEEAVTKLKQRVTEEEARYQRLNRDFESFKAKTSSLPEVRLQAEMMQLKMEKVSLEKQLERTQQSMVHYKQRFYKVVRELGKCKQKDLKDARAKERQTQRQMEHLTLHFQMQKDKETERNELNQIKKEVQELQRSHGMSSQAVGQFGRATFGTDLDLDEEDEHLMRLIAERDSLLKTGTYTMNDSLINNLEREIHELSRRKSEKTKPLLSERSGHTIY